MSEEHAQTALLVVDIQEAFAPVIPNWGALVARSSLAIQAVQLMGMPVTFTEQVPDKLGATVPSLTGLADGAPVWGKTAFSALGAEGLLGWLEARNVQHLLICGIEIPVCIYQTVLEARREGYQVTLLTDAIGARRSGDAEAVLSYLRGLDGLHLLPVETVFYALLQDAKDDRFRAYTRLVKAADSLG